MMATSAPTTVNYNFDFLKTPPGLFRAGEGALALAALISGAVGATCGDDGRFGFFLFVVITTFLQALLVCVLFVLRLDSTITFVNVPLTLLFNDSIVLAFHFMGSLLMLISIGWCYAMVTARIFASLFSIANFLTLVGLVYVDYLWWKGIQPDSKEQAQDTNGTTVTESSPTVLTLS